MKLKVYNSFHGTESTINVEKVRHGRFGAVAHVTMGELLSASMDLCGMGDCLCSGPFCATDDDDKVYSLYLTDDPFGRPCLERKRA